MSLRPARLRPSDLARLGGYGLRSRPLRAVLSALGIAIGIGAMTAVVGISASSRADLDRTLAELGTNLLTVSPGNTIFGKRATLPDESIAKIKENGPVRTGWPWGRAPLVPPPPATRPPACRPSSAARRHPGTSWPPAAP